MRAKLRSFLRFCKFMGRGVGANSAPPVPGRLGARSAPWGSWRSLNAGIAPRHEGQLCFSGTELKEPSSPPPPHFLPVPPASPSPGFDAKGGAFCSALKSYWVISCGGGQHLDFQRKI